MVVAPPLLRPAYLIAASALTTASFAGLEASAAAGSANPVNASSAACAVTAPTLPRMFAPDLILDVT
jgi:hypothetical protein